MHTIIDTKIAARNFSETLNRVMFGNSRLVVTRRGKPYAALVPMADLEQIEKIAELTQARIAAVKKEPK